MGADEAVQQASAKRQDRCWSRRAVLPARTTVRETV